MSIRGWIISAEGGGIWSHLVPPLTAVNNPAYATEIDEYRAQSERESFKTFLHKRCVLYTERRENSFEITRAWPEMYQLVPSFCAECVGPRELKAAIPCGLNPRRARSRAHDQVE